MGNISPPPHKPEFLPSIHFHRTFLCNVFEDLLTICKRFAQKFGAYVFAIMLMIVSLLSGHWTRVFRKCNNILS